MQDLLRTFTSLRQRNYRLYWFGQMISQMGSRMQSTGQVWLVLELSHSAWQLGLVGALHVGAAGFGFLSAATGVGALLSTLWLAWSNQKLAIRRALICMLAFAVLEALFAVSRIYLLSLLLIASVGFMEMAFAAQALTTLQTVSPDHLRGRVTSVQVLFLDGSLPLGYLLMGWLSGLYGAPIAMLIGALLSLLVAGAGWLWLKPAERDVVESVGRENG